MRRQVYGGRAAHLVQVAARILLDSPAARRLGRFLPEPFRRFVRSKVGPDRRAQGLLQHIQAQLLMSNLKEVAAWRAVRTWSDWEIFRDVRLDALRRSLGEFPPVPRGLRERVTRTLSDDGFHIENLVFESRPGLVVTANLYRPSDPTEPMPGIVVCHSHHDPKTDGELQDLGATWARCGCMVLVMDQLCHGERRQHPFRRSTDYRGKFRIGRQDYFFRYNVGMQLHLIGDSLIGWMVWDLMRGVDLLLGRRGVDPARIVLIGSVAGGGDPAAVAAALDRRIAAVVPFGFGAARKGSRDLHVEADYVGSGSWESTRNLRLSAHDGFAPWVILGAVAERHLIYAREFAWDSESDPVWKRLAWIYELCGAPGRLAAIHGSGSVSGRSPQDTHCNNVGPVHRKQIDRVLGRWFGISAPIAEHRIERPAEELLCLTPELPVEIEAQPLHQLAAALATERLAVARRRRSGLGARARRTSLQQDLGGLLGEITPTADPRVTSRTLERVNEERVVLEVEPAITVPAIVLRPALHESMRQPVVIGLAQEGPQRMLRDRADLVAELLRGGAAVCLPELRGTGDPGRGDEFRGRRSFATTASSGELMLGRTLLGDRLLDLRSVMRYLRTRPELDTARIALWGDSFAPTNPPNQDLAVPFDAETFPALCEPLGGLVALLGGLFEEDVRAVYLRGGLISYASLLDSPFCYVPHDVILPGVLRVGDLCDVAAALAPRPLRMEALVDGLNRRATADRLVQSFWPARAAYPSAGASERLTIEVETKPADEIAPWILTEIRR